MISSSTIKNASIENCSIKNASIGMKMEVCDTYIDLNLGISPPKIRIIIIIINQIGTGAEQRGLRMKSGGSEVAGYGEPTSRRYN